MSKLRMLQFFVLAAMLYVLAWISREGSPQLSTAAWKAGNVALGAYLGYWLDRRLFHANRIKADSSSQDQIRRAIIVAAAMLSISTGL